ncbi:MAG: zinc dependent phospholipase C family protein [Dehalococcoidia bacterium]
MPPIFLHMATALDVRRALATGALESEAGAFYLGATTPDIRVLTRRDRKETHFFDLDVLEHQDSVEDFLRTHGHLAAPERLDAQTVAFVCGYITHLVLDQAYIVSMYRPYFGQLSALGGDPQAGLMDRMLQYELDRRRREAPHEVDEIREALEGCSLRLNVGFLDSETLKKWQQVAIDQTVHSPTWERFRFQGGRHVRPGFADDPREYEDFLERVPEVLQQTITHVSTAQVDAFVEQSKEQAIRTIERYLGCA